jgi:signal transduction histidine kinase
MPRVRAANDMDLGIRGSAAIAAVVVDGVVTTLVFADSDLAATGTPANLPPFLAASVLMLVLGFATRWAPRIGVRIYLGTLFLLALGLIWWSRGAAGLAPLPVISLVGLAFPRRWVIACASLFTAVVGVMIGHFWGAGMVVGPLIGFIAACVFVIAFTEVAVGERRARAELAAAHTQLAEYAARVEELATTEERNRLARELHDSLGHYLTVIHVQLEAARTVLERDPVRAEKALVTAQRLTSEGLDDVRRSVRALHVSEGMQQPLADALGELVREHAATGVSAYLEVVGPPRPVTPPIELALYRAAQEALTNVRKHAQATRVRVELAYTGDLIRLSVEDDGRGARNPVDGFGLLGVRERARLAGGQLIIRCSDGAGFALAIEVPTSCSVRP